MPLPNFFIGQYRHSIDDKKRLSIPVKFRQMLGKQAVITKGLDNCLFLYPFGTWKTLAEKVGQLPLSRADARAFARTVLAEAMEVEVDNLGRILVPDYLKAHAKFKKNVVLAGLYNRIEIWDEKKWQDYKKKTEQQIGDVTEGLRELGV